MKAPTRNQTAIKSKKDHFLQLKTHLRQTNLRIKLVSVQVLNKNRPGCLLAARTIHFSYREGSLRLIEAPGAPR
jgi:hypothetical protein